MHLKLSCYLLKIDYHKYILCKPHGDHKTKTYSRYTRGKEKVIREYHYRKLSNHKAWEEERNKGTKELQNNKNNKMVTVSPDLLKLF